MNVEISAPIHPVRVLEVDPSIMPGNHRKGLSSGIGISRLHQHLTLVTSHSINVLNDRNRIREYSMIDRLMDESDRSATAVIVRCESPVDVSFSDGESP